MANRVSVLLLRIARVVLIAAAIESIVILSIAVYRLWPRSIDLNVREPRLVWNVDRQNNQTLNVPGRTLIGFLGRYDNELFAYLMFDFVRSQKALADRRVMLIYRNPGNQPQYWILMDCPEDLLACIAEGTQLEARGYANMPSWGYFTPDAVARYADEARLFFQAYSTPVGDVFGKLSPKQRAVYVSRFLRFKSATDLRVLIRTDPTLRPLTEHEAAGMAADIIAVADFYSLPLSYFLGIGAMENNYLDVKGDQEHRVWKRRAQPGDVVVRRGRRGVLVEDPALGVWQITRETLRYAHALYVRDKRDYSQLPERLRPSRTLDIDHVPPEVLTTYAGLILRHLLDHFHGDVAQAVGAYNGGPGNPNSSYEEGVSRVADYARRILDRAALLNRTAIEQIGPEQ